MSPRDDLPERVRNHPGLTDGYRPNAALVIRSDTGLLLWCERIRYPGCWQFPQGGVDPGESPWEAALREAGEELGLPNPATALQRTAHLEEPLHYDFTAEFIEDFLERRGQSFVGQAQHYFLADFIGDEAEITLQPPPGCEPEFCRWKWAGTELVETVPWFKRDVVRQALSAFGLLD